MMLFMTTSFAFVSVKWSAGRPGGAGARDDPATGNFLQGDGPTAFVDGRLSLLHVGENRGIGRIGASSAGIEKERLADLEHAAGRLGGLVVHIVIADPAG